MGYLVGKLFTLFGAWKVYLSGVWLLVLFSVVAAPAFGADTCLPSDYSMSQLLEIRRTGFVVESDQQRNALAITLAGCIADPDPALRDGLAYEGISAWLRGRDLTAETIDALYDTLSAKLTGDADPGGFQKPFAALLLSEVARTDRIGDIFGASRRAELVALAANYLESVRDYRGFSETEGWRHGVAHGADFVLQLVLNANIHAAQIRRLMTAVSTQIAPAGEIFYHYSEPERLARAVFYAYRRGIVEDPYWQEWFEQVSGPQPLENWNVSHSSQAGLAKRHNTLAFLLVMHFNATNAGDAQGEALDRIVQQAITRVQGG